MQIQNNKQMKSANTYGSGLQKLYTGNKKVGSTNTHNEIIYHTPRGYNTIKKNIQLINKINVNSPKIDKNGSLQVIQTPSKKLYSHKRTISMQTLGDATQLEQCEMDPKTFLKALDHHDNMKSNQDLTKKIVNGSNSNRNQNIKYRHNTMNDELITTTKVGKENAFQGKISNEETIFQSQKKMNFLSSEKKIEQIKNTQIQKSPQLKWNSPTASSYSKRLQNFQKKQTIVTNPKKLENLTCNFEKKQQYKFHTNVLGNIENKTAITKTNNKFQYGKPLEDYKPIKYTKKEVTYTKRDPNLEKFNKENISSKDFKIEDFSIGPLLGKGKFGQVNIIRHKETGFLCALKKIEKLVIKQERLEHQMMRELKIQSYLYHPNIINLYGFFVDHKYVYLLLELCSGGELYKLLKKKRKFDEEFTSNIIKQVCEAVKYLHSNSIIHRDIKPQNIIIQNGVVKLCDFGWAVYLQDELRRTMCGTPLYLSPEILKGDQYDYSTDIWTIGILTYELLIGSIPFKISSESELAKIIQDKVEFPSWMQISQGAKDFILKILQKNPRERITIQQLLGHPFLRTATENIIALL